jgi:hypothetical protein
MQWPWHRDNMLNMTKKKNMSVIVVYEGRLIWICKLGDMLYWFPPNPKCNTKLWATDIL